MMTEPARYRSNPPLAQDMIASAWQRWQQYGSPIWPESKRVYQSLASRLHGFDVLEAGCGIGWGAHMLSAALATDVDLRHVRFAHEWYPELKTAVWDIEHAPWPESHEIVVAIEVLEHVVDQRAALAHLLDSASLAVWLSTPNRNHPGLGQERPDNPFHVRELTPTEFVALLPNGAEAVIWHPWEPRTLDEATTVTPLLYEICYGARPHHDPN